MRLDRPLSPEDFALQRRILTDRIARRRATRQSSAADATRLRELVTAQLAAETREARAAARAAARADPRQMELAGG